jgi:hypothetical protein
MSVAVANTSNNNNEYLIWIGTLYLWRQGAEVQSLTTFQNCLLIDDWGKISTHVDPIQGQDHSKVSYTFSRKHSK